MKLFDGNKVFNLDDSDSNVGRGSLLVAKPTLTDHCFARSVIMMIDADDKGAMGLIVNRPSGYTLHDVLPELGVSAQLAPIYVGGPVNLEMMFYLHRLPESEVPNSVPLGNGLRLGGDYEAIKHYVAHGGEVGGVVKFIAGYSGWDAGQLESEIKRRSWAALNGAPADLVMSNQEEPMWRQAVELFGDRYRTWLNWPSDVSMN